MATLAEHRSRGVGGRLLETGAAEIVRRCGMTLWCRGHLSAGAFYERHGFAPVGDVFHTPHGGPHKIYVRDLTR
jgi:GNAT superfamily N-acetyltransferase